VSRRTEFGVRNMNQYSKVRVSVYVTISSILRVRNRRTDSRGKELNTIASCLGGPEWRLP